MNCRDCPACAERYPLQHGLHQLPDGNAMRCAGVLRWGGFRLIVNPLLPPGVVAICHDDGRVQLVDLFREAAT